MSNQNNYIDEKLSSAEPGFLLLRRFLGGVGTPLSSLFALWAEIHEIATQVIEPEIGLAKLGWWQEEWQRWQQGNARHPVTQSLPVQPDVSLTPALSYQAMLLNQPTVEQEHDLDRLLQAATAPFSILESSIVDPEQDRDPEAWVNLARGSLLESTPILLSRQRAPLPLAWQADLGLSVDQLATGELTPILQKLVPPELPVRSVASAYCAIKRLDFQLLLSEPDRYLSGHRANPLRRVLKAWSAARKLTLNP